MFWRFWQKKEGPAEAKKEIRLVVPRERTRRILNLCDQYGAHPKNQDKEAKFVLWSAIGEMFPQVEEEDRQWTLEFPSATRVEVVGQEEEIQ